jgi:hypothetical protein
MILDTTGGLFPEGTFVFTIESIPETGQYPSGHKYVQFHFETEVEGEMRTYSERFVVWMIAPLMQALGFKEVKPGHYDFEPTACMGKEIRGTIVHEKMEKGKRIGETVARMKDIQPLGGTDPRAAALAAQAPASPAAKSAAKSDDEIPF